MLLLDLTHAAVERAGIALPLRVQALCGRHARAFGGALGLQTVRLILRHERGVGFVNGRPLCQRAIDRVLDVGR